MPATSPILGRWPRRSRGLVSPVEPSLDDALEGLTQDKYDQGEGRRENRRHPLPDSAGNAEAGHHPDRSRGGQAVHDLPLVVGTLEDRAAAEKADPGDDPLDGAA